MGAGSSCQEAGGRCTRTVAADAAPRAKLRLQASSAQRGNSVVDLISSMDSREVMLKIFTWEISAW